MWIEIKINAWFCIFFLQKVWKKPRVKNFMMEIMMFNLMWISRIKNVSYIYDLLCLSTKSSVLKIILHRTCTLSKFNAVFTRGCIVFLESSINIQTLIIWYRHSLNVSSIIYTNWIIRTYFYQIFFPKHLLGNYEKLVSGN